MNPFALPTRECARRVAPTNLGFPVGRASAGDPAEDVRFPEAMLTSDLRHSVFQLLGEHGSLTAKELMTRDAVLASGALRRALLTWLERGWLKRERALAGAYQAYHYSLTETGRAVLVGEREDREPVVDPERPARRTVMVEGKEMTIDDAAAAVGLKPKTLRRRLERGMAPEDALRPRREPRRLEVDGEVVTLQVAAARAGVTYDSVRRRLAEGRSPELVAAPAYFRPAVNPITITAALERAGKPLPLRDLAVAMGVRWSALRVPVAEMFAAGALERTRAGTRGGPWSYSVVNR
jgi:hypothetical protein